MLDTEGSPDRLRVQAHASFSIVHQRALPALFGGCKAPKIGELTLWRYLYNTRIGIVVNTAIPTSPSYSYKSFFQDIRQVACQGLWRTLIYCDYKHCLSSWNMAQIRLEYTVSWSTLSREKWTQLSCCYSLECTPLTFSPSQNIKADSFRPCEEWTHQSTSWTVHFCLKRSLLVVCFT